MQVTGAAPSSDPTSAQSKTATAPTVDYNAFLRLLIAQMRNQDPTKPMDSAQYLGQLASFSAVEQGVQTNAKLDALMTNSMLSQADAIIGRTLASADGATSGQSRPSPSRSPAWSRPWKAARSFLSATGSRFSR